VTTTDVEPHTGYRLWYEVTGSLPPGPNTHFADQGTVLRRVANALPQKGVTQASNPATASWSI
jgi:hypothetical protein